MNGTPPRRSHAVDLTGVLCISRTTGRHYATETVIPHVFEDTGTRHVINACTEHARIIAAYRPDDDVIVYTSTGTQRRGRQPRHRADILTRIDNTLAAEQLLGAVGTWHAKQVSS